MAQINHIISLSCNFHILFLVTILNFAWFHRFCNLAFNAYAHTVCVGVCVEVEEFDAQ